MSKSVLDLQCHLGLLPKECEGISVIDVSSPAMWSGVMGHVPLSFSQSASALMRCAETIDPHVAMRLTHPTVGELSLNNATRFSRRVPHTDSMTSHKRSKPAILRLELVIPSTFMIEIIDLLRPFPSENYWDA